MNITDLKANVAEAEGVEAKDRDAHLWAKSEVERLRMLLVMAESRVRSTDHSYRKAQNMTFIARQFLAEALHAARPEVPPVEVTPPSTLDRSPRNYMIGGAWHGPEGFGGVARYMDLRRIKVRPLMAQNGHPSNHASDVEFEMDVQDAERGYDLGLYDGGPSKG